MNALKDQKQVYEEEASDDSDKMKSSNDKRTIEGVIESTV